MWRSFDALRMTRTLLAVLLFIFCAVLPAKATWLDSNWTKRVKLTIDADKVNGDLANFPVFVDLNGMPASFFTTIKDNGADLRVTKTDGSSEVPFELVYLDTNNGAGELHFQANGTLSGTTNSDWYLYYGYNGATAYARGDTYGSENVWTQGYVAVYHLNEDGNATASGYIDSTSNLNHGMGVSMTSASDVTGKFGRAQEFDGIADYIATETINGNLLEDYTLSLWINSDDFSSEKYIYSFGYNNTNSLILFYHLASVRVIKPNPTDETIGASLNTSSWLKLDLTHSVSDINLYKDSGVILSNGSYSHSIDTAAHHIGYAVPRNKAGVFYDGIVDEYRLSSEARSAEWIWTEYQNQNSPDTFYSVGSEEENSLPVTNGLAIWWDASDLSTLVTDANGRVSEWIDKSGNGYNGSQATYDSRPYSGLETVNNLNVLTFNADDMYFSLDSEYTDTRTMFMVALEDTSNGGFGFFLHRTVYFSTFYRDLNYGSIYSSTAIDSLKDGLNRMNYSSVDPLETQIPANEQFLYSVKTYNNPGPTFLRISTPGTYSWRGNMAEILVYDTALTNGEILEVESYLSSKWGLDTSLAIDETYPLDDSSSYRSDHGDLKVKFDMDVFEGAGNISVYHANGDLVEAIAIGDAQITGLGSPELNIALTDNLDDNSDYYVQIDAGAIEDVFGNAFAGITDDSTWNFSTADSNGLPVVNGLAMWFDASDTASLITDANGRVSEWKNLYTNSDYRWDAKQSDASSQPYSGQETVNNLNVLTFNADDMYLSLDAKYNDARTVFMVALEDSVNGGYNFFLSRTDSWQNTFNRDTSTGYIYAGQASDYLEQGFNRLNFSAVDPLVTQLPANEQFLYTVKTYSGSPYVQAISKPGSNSWRGNMAEILIYNESLSNGEILEVEAYLANKWGLDTSLAIDETYPLDDSSSYRSEYGDLRIKFNKDVQEGAGNISVYHANGDLVESIAVGDAQITGFGSPELTIALTDNLDDTSDYYVQIDAGAIEDDFGNVFAGIADDSTWNFSTADSSGLPVVNGLAMWFDASDTASLITDANGRVSEWKNLYTNSDYRWDAKQSDSSSRPYSGQETVNNLNVLSFNADDMYFSLDTQHNTARTVFVVALEDSVSGGYNYFLARTSSWSNTFFRHTSLGYIYHPSASNYLEDGFNSLNFTNIDPNATVFPASQQFLYAVKTYSGSPYIQKISTAGASAWRGNIAEILIYDEALSNGEIIEVSSYLVSKWGFELNYSSLGPADGSSGLLPTDDLTMTFPQAVDILNGNLSIFEANGDLFETIDVNSGQVTGNGTTTVTFNPSSDLNPLSDYYVQIQGGAFTDAANGNTAFTGIYNSTEWNFTTGRAFDPSGFSNSKKITILHSQVNGDVNNFPVYIDLGHMPSSFFSVVKADGSDIRVTNSAQDEEMPFELVSIDKSAKTGELWFRADSLSGTSNSDFYLWYGNGDATAYSADHVYGSQNVWSQGYVAVYHMNEDPNGDVVDAIKDSSSYANHVTPSGSMTSDDLVEGRLGASLDFDGSDDYLESADTASFNVSQFMVSAWVRSSDPSLNRGIFQKYNSGFGDFEIHQRSTGKFAFILNNNSPSNVMQSSSDVISDTWQFVSAGFDGSSKTLYYNGELEADVAFANPLNQNIGTILVGQYNGQEWIGLLDEVRLSNQTHSRDWVKTEYNNQNSPEAFYLIDDQVPGTETSKPMFMMGGY